MIGTKIAHYEVTAKLGAGGMGEVYRARDTHLERDVALKLLPDALVGDADRLARFEREAKTLAGLNHPNIAQVYGLEGDGATRAIVMELVDGRDLATVLGTSRMPLEDVLPIARQIAEALDAAHEQGVIHRDLKPANVMLTADEQVKVLDFGLAKSTDGEAVRSSSGDPVDSRTMTTAPTQAGVILGTAAYMSPEQARGKLLDRRSDIWSFGCVLYEMLTGRRAFDGETMTDVLAAIVRGEPDGESLERVAPPRLVRLVQRCLRKDHRERLRDIGEAALMLKEIAAGDDGRDAAAQAPAPSKRAPGAGPWKVIAGIAGLAAVALAALQFGPWATDSGDGAPQSAPVTTMSLLTDVGGVQRSPSLSPDGKQMLYVAEDGGDLDIFLLRVGGQNAVNLTAEFDSDDDHPAWSPDGERIAFDSNRSGGGIFIMGATGESARRVSDEGFHPSWSPDGTQLTFGDENIADVYSRIATSRLHVVDVESGARSIIPVNDDVAQGQWSPDSRWIAYWSADLGRRDIRIVRASASDSGDFIAVTDDAATDWEPRWAPDGEALYFVSDRGGSPDLWKIAINPTTGRPAGAPQAVTTGVARVASFSIDQTGERILLGVTSELDSFERIPFDPLTERTLGPSVPIFSSKNQIEQFSLSRDGQRIAYRSGSLQEDLFTIRVDGTDRRRLTNDMARDRGPDWGPGDEWLVFYSNRGDHYAHWAIGADGRGLRMIATEPSQGLNDPSWSHDGKRISATTRGSAVYDVDPAWFESGADFEPLQISGNQLDFVALGWSSDDRHLSGCTDWSGHVATYELATGEIKPVRDEQGKRLDCGSSFLLDGWIDPSRLILWDESNQRTVLWDVDDEQLREIPGIPGPSKFDVGDDGRTLYLVRTIRDAEIWMLELGREGS